MMPPYPEMRNQTPNIWKPIYLLRPMRWPPGVPTVMDMNAKMLLGAVLVGAGLVLALILPELRFRWFEGRPLGILLALIGVFELGEGYLRERRERDVNAGPERPDRG